MGLSEAIGKKFAAQESVSAERRKQLENFARLAKENPTLFGELSDADRTATAMFAASQSTEGEQE